MDNDLNRRVNQIKRLLPGVCAALAAHSGESVDYLSQHPKKALDWLSRRLQRDIDRDEYARDVRNEYREMTE